MVIVMQILKATGCSFRLLKMSIYFQIFSFEYSLQHASMVLNLDFFQRYMMSTDRTNNVSMARPQDRLEPSSIIYIDM